MHGVSIGCHGNAVRAPLLHGAAPAPKPGSHHAHHRFSCASVTDGDSLLRRQVVVPNSVAAADRLCAGGDGNVLRLHSGANRLRGAAGLATPRHGEEGGEEGVGA